LKLQKTTRCSTQKPNRNFLMHSCVSHITGYLMKCCARSLHVDNLPFLVGNLQQANNTINMKLKSNTRVFQRNCTLQNLVTTQNRVPNVSIAELHSKYFAVFLYIIRMSVCITGFFFCLYSVAFCVFFTHVRKEVRTRIEEDSCGMHASVT
jgi:hypothetical protein